MSVRTMSLWHLSNKPSFSHSVQCDGNSVQGGCGQEGLLLSPVPSLRLQFLPQKGKLPEFAIHHPQLQVAETLSQSGEEYWGLHPTSLKGSNFLVRRNNQRRLGLQFSPKVPSVKQGCHSKRSRTLSLSPVPQQWHRGFATERQAVITESSIALPEGIAFIWNRVW